MSLPTQIQLIYPEINDLDFLDSISLQDAGDGSGPYIALWNHPNLTKPNQAELDAVAGQAAEVESFKATSAALRTQRKTEAFTALKASLAERLQITITSPADLVGKADEVRERVAAKRGDAPAPTSRETLIEGQLDVLFNLVVLMYRNA